MNEQSEFCQSCGSPLDSSDSLKRRQSIPISDEKINVNNSVNRSVSPTLPSPNERHKNSEEKNPFLAWFCSLIIPGLGQVYNGKTVRGFGIFIGTIIGLICFIIPGLIVWIYGMYDAYSITKKMNNSEIPFQPIKTGHLILFVIFAIIVGLVGLVVVAGMLANIPSGSSAFQSSSGTIVTKPLNSMALTINDFPTGWRTYGSPTSTADYYQSNFLKLQMMTPYTVYQTIYRNATVTDAQNFYNTEESSIKEYRVDSVNIGDAGFDYITQDSIYIIFREDNIVVKVQYGIGGFVPDSSLLSIDDAKQYAEIIANRI